MSKPISNETNHRAGAVTAATFRSTAFTDFPTTTIVYCI
jgi:hypothetical protein